MLTTEQMYLDRQKYLGIYFSPVGKLERFQGYICSERWNHYWMILQIMFELM